MSGVGGSQTGVNPLVPRAPPWTVRGSRTFPRSGRAQPENSSSVRTAAVGGSRLHSNGFSWWCECMTHGQVRPWRMPRVACSHAYPGKRPSVRTKAPDEAKPRRSAQYVAAHTPQYSVSADPFSLFLLIRTLPECRSIFGITSKYSCASRRNLHTLPHTFRNQA